MSAGTWASAQSELGTWNILNVRADLSDKWGVFAEAQLRSLRLYDHFHYYEYKGGVTYRLDKNFSLTAGVGRYKTYSAGGTFKDPILSNEIRTWGQLNIKNKLGQLDIEHRYRAEQRFVRTGYRNRFRYRLSALLPLKRWANTGRSLALQGSNEIFLTNRAPFFERNRAALHLNYTLSKSFSMQAGLLHQYDYRLTDEIGRSFLQIAGLFSIDWKKEKATLQVDVED